MRKSPFQERNQRIGNWSNWSAQKNNLEFVSEALVTMKQLGVGNDGEFAIVLIGSRDLPGVTLRQAQSVLRWDRRPSFWSHAFLINSKWNGKSNIGKLPIVGVPLYSRAGAFPDPKNNGVVTATLDAYADPKIDANIALLSVAKTTEMGPKSLDKKLIRTLRARVNDPNADRLRYELWDSLCAWNRYLWSSGDASNPLRNNIPVPATAFVEMVYEAINLDLVPGASERNSAPEHIWNTSHWWLQHQATDEGFDQPYTTCGCFAIRDPGCSTLD